MIEGWISQARLPIADVSNALGLIGKRRHYQCPLNCGNDLPVYSTGDKWKCCRCEARGDAIDLVSFALHGHRLRECSDEERATVRAWFDPSTVRQRVTPVTREPDVTVSEEELQAWWGACLPLTGRCPGSAFLRSRSIDWSTMGDIVRLTPLPLHGCAWWPAGRGKTWRLVTRGYRDGVFCNVHGRAIGRLPFGSDGKPMKKALWARGMAASNVLMWNGVPASQACVVLVAEGITDFLTFCQVEWRSPVCVFGATSGGFGRLNVPENVPIVQAPDAGDKDGKGDKYAIRLRESMPDHMVSRVQLPDGVDVNAYAMGGGDLRGLVGMALAG